MSKIDKMIEVLFEGLDGKEIFKLVINKMTNPAKRQLINELLNNVLGTGYMKEGYSMFDYSKKNNSEVIDEQL